MSGHSQDRGTAKLIAFGGESQQIKPLQNTEMKQYLCNLEKNRTEGSSMKAVHSLELRRSLTIRLINTA